MKSSHASNSNACLRIIIFVLLAIIGLQWIMISVLIQHRHEAPLGEATASTNPILEQSRYTLTASTNKTTILDNASNNPIQLNGQNNTSPPGVFATVIFRAPRWMHMR